MGTYKGFNSVEFKKPQRSTFDLSEDKRLTLQMGYLYPVMFKECVPSDLFDGDTEMLVRVAPLLAPIYDQLQVYVHYFFVPYRLLWNEWEAFITGGQFGPDPETPPPVVPQFQVSSILAVNATAFAKSRLPDYLGVPLLTDLPNAPDPDDFSTNYLDCMPFLVYQKVWYDYYRDRRFTNDDAISLPINSGIIGVNGITAIEWEGDYMTLRSRCYKHDYFTSANIAPQLGAEVIVPTGINYLPTSLAISEATGLPLGGDIISNSGDTAIGAQGIRIENLESVGPLVNDFRTAYALQVWLERNAVGGSRYTESIHAHFGVPPQDSRLQRAEYIGGGLIPIKISEVVSTAWSTNADSDAVPQANMAGHGMSFGNTRGFRWFCPEHGAIIGILSIVNPPSYHQGLPRYFRRRSFLDYPFPTFAKLGEQEVYDWEIYAASVNLTGTGAQLDSSTDWPVFGYQSRYADWKTGRNTSHGDFHDTLLFWSLTFDFGITPTLDNSFVEFNPNIENRIFAAPTTDNFWIYLHNRVRVKRPLPYFGTPNTLGFQ